MRTLRLRAGLCACLFAAGLAGCAALWAGGVAGTLIPLYALAPVTALSAALLIGLIKKISAAALIKENSILHIHSVIVKRSGARASSGGDIQIDISCFGVLIGARAYTFNKDGIRLHSVEIGKEYIHLTFGRRKRLRSIGVLHGAIDAANLRRIADLLHYETGIVPKVAISEEARLCPAAIAARY